MTVLTAWPSGVLTELMKRYCLECRYNVGVGHVLGALCAGWQELL